MPRTIAPLNAPAPADLPRLRWNADQYESLFMMGLLPSGKYELIAGDVVEKMPIKDSHAYIVTLLFAFFSRFCAFPLLRPAFTLAISTNDLPEPDFAVLTTPTPTRTARGYLQPTDLQVVVEVSDAALTRDLTAKATLYAAAGIEEYWVIDVVGRCLRVHVGPNAGIYTRVIEYAETDLVAPGFSLTDTVLVSALLP